ncbi:DNA translocase FtsK [Paenibacillus psychroresistens]|uniref:DNA translocase FtsK n=1 Tax=Paenibacillus psychroresistens TaxID=1778678 RepID=A0A6B8RJR6_9BACL|nr:DNA translocase FtsK [Paenibacillus psychroresistens]
MAKGKKKKKTAAKTSLRYELYGIVILILSVIALSGGGRVARALTYMFRFLIGTSDKVIPIICIYIGLYVMMKRVWPSSWSRWKTGVVLGLFGWLVINHMSMIHSINSTDDLKIPVNIIQVTWASMMDGLEPDVPDAPILATNVGGGMVGALLYATLYFLFGNLGSNLIAYTLCLIGIILITGISVVDLIGKLRNRTSGMQSGVLERVSGWFTAKDEGPIRKGPVIQVKKQKIHNPMDDELDEENYFSDRPKGKPKSVFFEIFPSTPEEHDEEPAHPIAPLIQLLPKEVKRAQPQPVSPVEEEEPLPFIRNFQDQVEPIIDMSPPPVIVIKKPAEGQAEATDIPFVEATGKKSDKPYELPSLGLLSLPAPGKAGSSLDYKANARKLETTLESFGVKVKVLDVVIGPAVTRYEIQPDVGVKVSRIVSLTDDIALALAAKDIRMEAPIPGKSAIGIEVPNSEVSIVTMREVMESSAFRDSAAKLSVVLGRDISGQPIVANLARMPHLLVAGATGSGKSVCINGIITSILYKAKPEEVKFLMIDPKMVELNMYNGIPHLLAPVVTDPRRASLALKKVVLEMEKRYEAFSKTGTRNIEGYNNLLANGQAGNPMPPIPLIVVIVDELADLMMVAANDVEDSITRLAQMARAAGIHLIIATQRPSVDVITGVIKANIPSRIAFGVSSMVDSRTILDMGGAEKLLGRGDMLYLPVGASKPVRVQGAYLSDEEVESVVHFVSKQEEAQYQEEMVPELEEKDDIPQEVEDDLFNQAVQIVVEAKQASVSLLQRRMRIGYTRAARLIDSMEAKGIVGPYEGSKPREVLLSIEQFHHNRMSS